MAHVVKKDNSLGVHVIPSGPDPHQVHHERDHESRKARGPRNNDEMALMMLSGMVAKPKRDMTTLTRIAEQYGLVNETEFLRHQIVARTFGEIQKYIKSTIYND